MCRIKAGGVCVRVRGTVRNTLKGGGTEKRGGRTEKRGGRTEKRGGETDFKKGGKLC